MLFRSRAAQVLREEAAVLDEITDIRIEHPRWVMKEARRRKRRKTLAPDGRLVLAAVDHPARGVNEIRGDAMAMGDRHQYLARARRVLDEVTGSAAFWPFFIRCLAIAASSMSSA